MKFFISLFLILFSNALCPQIVVVRQDKDGNYGPLTEEDILDERIAAILQKYTWPSCIAQDLTEEEKKALLIPNSWDKESSEDLFIKKKLQEISKELDVVFIPDTLYELFLIKKHHAIGKTIPLNIDEKIVPLINSGKKLLKNEIEYKNISKLKNIEGVRNYLMFKIYRLYNDINKVFFSSIKNNNILPLPKNGSSSKEKHTTFKIIFSLKTQKVFVEFLLSIYSDTHFKKGVDITSFIEGNKEDFLQKIIDLPFNLKIAYKDILNKPVFSEKLDFNLCLKCINLNYLAHYQNKAILLRGTSLVNKENLFGEKIHFIGSVIHHKIDYYPYSISFGNSLFAGCFYDSGACVYNHLTEDKKVTEDKEEKDLWEKSIAGYALFIDKFEYVAHSLSNLFFISPFCLEAGLFGSGEFFHPRTKPAIVYKEDDYEGVNGVHSKYKFLDPLGIFLITRDPYKQATLFADYMAKNMIIIQRGDFNMLAPEEQEGFRELIKNHYLLKQEYKIIDFLNNNIRRIKKINFLNN